MLEINEFLVLDYVRDHGPTTRTDIARDLGLSAASVSRIVGRLVRDALVTETGTVRSPGGRPRTVVSFRRDAGAVIAIDLGGTRTHAALADLGGTILE
jgi:DNA-binding MarR family transcriptional regulator